MAIQFYEGSNGTWGTEYSLPNASTTLTPQTTSGLVQAVIDLNALAAGDEYEVIVYERARASDTQRILDRFYFAGAQSRPLWMSPAFTMARGWDVTLRRIAGTDRTITWSVRRWPDT